ncbi:RNA-binding cell elongation regulator Jag/EloR [Anaerospora sp.]|jgi:spoIIIJ-associated protein|uniref:RNA-binding cell elongation regulator Jag/EloR n=1 Tax=Anaerospora sp. TaxID=1960278 RepID=UPI0028A1157C|nr:RNA-binding cell elongation regulator Jag/EloR [Anaerospora sp.]
MNVVEKSAKSIDEAVEQALKELGLKPEQVDVEVLEQPAKALFGFIGGRQAKVRVTARKIDPVEVANDFLKQIFTTMKISVSVEKITTDDHVLFNLRGNDLGVLIGKHGQTLDALQYLVNLAANRDSMERVRVLLDVEDYRKRRADTLTQLALRLADKVKRRGEKVILEPMSSHERKIIHMALQNDQRIATFSEGEDPFRKVVIALKR